MEILEVKNSGEVMAQLVELSAQWEAEQCSWGYAANGKADIEGYRIFIATQGEQVIGYLFGTAARMEHYTCVMDADTPYFEIEELYVRPDYRSQGIGKKLMSHVEETVKGEGIPYLMLNTATKNYKAILHFYIEEMGMEFWSACLFKKL